MRWRDGFRRHLKEKFLLQCYLLESFNIVPIMSLTDHDWDVCFSSNAIVLNSGISQYECESGQKNCWDESNIWKPQGVETVHGGHVPLGNEQQRHVLTYPPGEIGAVGITDRDMESLQPKRWLRDNIIEFYIMWVFVAFLGIIWTNLWIVRLQQLRVGANRWFSLSKDTDCEIILLVLVLHKNHNSWSYVGLQLQVSGKESTSLFEQRSCLFLQQFLFFEISCIHCSREDWVWASTELD